MENLTEDNIKIAMLRFLKGNYKYRKRNQDGSGETEASLNMAGKGGIIADGYLTFIDENNEEFVATFEATSFETKEELVYVSQNDKLFWDSVATAFVFSMTCLLLVHGQGFYPMQVYHPLAAILIGALAIVLFFFFYKRLFQTFSISRYRYIYALEQFKRYYADEQWIAFGEDVFPNYKDKYYIELKKQCFKMGIGLVIVSRNLKCRFVATPARHNIFVNKRELVHFKAVDEPTKAVASISPTNLKGKVEKWLNTAKTIDIYRFKKIPFHQLIISSMAFVIILLLLIIEWRNGPINYIASVEKYNEGLAKLAKTNQIEDSVYIIDTPLEPGVFEIEKKEAFRKVEKILSTQKATDIIVADKRRQALIYYDCERFSNYQGIHYIIKDTILLDFEKTVKRLKTLKNYDLEATAVWRGCLGDRRMGYVLYFNIIYQDSILAQLDAAEIRTFFDYRTIQSSAKLVRLDIRE